MKIGVYGNDVGPGGRPNECPERGRIHGNVSATTVDTKHSSSLKVPRGVVVRGA